MIIDQTTREVFSRQIKMKQIGEDGQRKLAEASVLVVGCGGLGAPALYYLAGMGICHLGLCDNDTISLSNLNRQILYTMDDLGKPKAAAASARLRALNPQLQTSIYGCSMTKRLAHNIVPEYDIVVDCLDNFKTRFILNDACVAAGKPLVHAGLEGFYGQLMTIIPGEGPCLRCLFPGGIKEKAHAPVGVIGTTPGVLGSMQALEVLKYLLKLPLCSDGLLVYDSLNMSLEKVPLQPLPGCICRKQA